MENSQRIKLILAPMATLSHEALRRAIFFFGGCDEYYTEMIHAPSLLNGGPFEKYYLRQGPEPQKIVWQLTGADAKCLAAAAKITGALGGAGIDLNMGCSAPEIWKRGAGIAWMQKPLAETAAMIGAVRKSLDEMPHGGTNNSPRLSAKIRLGGEDWKPENFLAFCAMLIEEGIERITLHPRTKKEKYKTAPRWEYVRLLAEFVEKKTCGIVLNGGVYDTQSFEAAVKAAPGIEGVMIGRAAAQKPWIFAELRGASPQADIPLTALRFLDDLEECQPPEFWKTRRNRFFQFFCANVQFSHYLFTALKNCPDNAACRAFFLRQDQSVFQSAPMP
ncbi:MAG: tRNA-dihydrouridine synthase family protein [Treponemataceae bacterium]|nr:MAG: tRNA-dihydrouridine synthase family protein [Treponemataceae bacterium]